METDHRGILLYDIMLEKGRKFQGCSITCRGDRGHELFSGSKTIRAKQEGRLMIALIAVRSYVGHRRCAPSTDTDALSRVLRLVLIRLEHAYVTEFLI